MMLLACNTTKHVPQGDYLYTGAHWKYDSAKVDKDAREDLESIVRPKPNSAFLGIPFKLWLLNLFPHAKSGKGFMHKFFNSITEEPVLLSQVNTFSVNKNLKNHLFDHGYFQGVVNAEMEKDEKTRKAKVKYIVKPGKRYRIREIYYPQDSLPLSKLFREASKETILARNDFLNLETLETERMRIDDFVKKKGYFFFQPDHILFRVDSLHDGFADLYYTVKKETPEAARETWTINDIKIYGNYNIAKDSVVTKQKGKREKSFTLIDNQNKYRSMVYDQAIVMKEGQLYNKELHGLSIERLMNLNTFRFTKFVFFPDTSTGRNLLNTRLYVTPLKKRTLQLEASANTKTGNFVGSELNIKWRNVNLFKGAEILDLRIGAGFDLQLGGKSVQNANAYTLQSEATLTIPRIVPHFWVRTGLNSYLPKTGINLGLEYIQRPGLYTQRSAKIALEYTWKFKKTIEHTLRPIRIQGYDPSNITPTFDSILNEDVTLKASFEKQLIIGSQYQFFYNNTFEAKQKFTYAMRFNAATSGNLFNLLSPAKVDTPGAVKFLNIPVTQFIKLEADLRGYLKLGKNLVWANRVIGGIALAYKNSAIAPYAEQFFAGGSSSIRAFRIRTLGPGSYYQPNQAYAANESGDIKVELNTELRYSLGKYLRFAAFTDAGNIWLRKEPADKPGSGFSKGDLFREMAVGSGLGLRLDFSILLLRFDLAMPLRKPWLPDGQRWVLGDIDLGSKTWRKENLILNIGVGYPF